MNNNKNFHEMKGFYSIPEVCETLGLNMDKLRYQCLLHNIFPDKLRDTLGLNSQNFQKLSAMLCMERRGENPHDDPWA